MTISKFKQATIFGGLLAATITLNAFAFEIDQVQHGDQPFLTEFNALDKNTDQSLNAAEIQADKSIKKQDVKAFDLNKDGRLNYAEFSELKTKLGQAAIKTTMSDSWITTKVKARLLEEESLKSFKISVETHEGQVLLSGFVADADLKAKAEQVVNGIEGVKTVKNAIVVKS